jgi:pimeloyl-ACP methyl ester carboxylesterase
MKIMINTIVPFSDKNTPIKMWPALAASGKLLRIQGDEEAIFFYDTNMETFPREGKKSALILVHGLGDEADSWRHLIPLLSPHYRVLALDLPGFGRSKTPGSINRKRHTQAVLRILGEAGSAVLVGSSMGGALAEVAAFERPDLVKGIILLDGCLPLSGALQIGSFCMSLPLVGKKWYRNFRSNHEAAYRSLQSYYADLEGLPEADRNFLRERVIARVESDTQERAYFGSLRSLTVNRLFSVLRFAPKIQRFPGKLLILWGEKDRILSLKTADALRSARPDAVYKVIQGAGHLPHQEKPAETAEAILEFLRTFYPVPVGL